MHPTLHISRGPLILVTLTVLLGGFSAQAQDEAAWQEHFVGRFVMARFDLPASSDGFQIEYQVASKSTRLRHQERETAVSRYGIGVVAGEITRITKLRLKKKHIEVHLNGGGRNAWGASLNDSAFQGPKKVAGGSRINLRFDMKLKDLADDLPLSRIENLLRKGLIFDRAEMQAQKERVTSQAKAERQRILQAMARQKKQAQSAAGKTGTSSGIPASRVPPRRSPTDAMSVIAANLKNRVEARSVAKFCLGHIEQNFDRIAAVVNDYAALRQKWQRSLPASIAEKRYQEMIAKQRQIFTSREELFHVVGSGSLKAYLTPQARILITDLKPDRGQKFLNAFVEVSYPSPQASPQFRGGRRLKKTYLMIPVQGGWVLATPPLPSSSLLGPAVQRLREAEEYW